MLTTSVTRTSDHLTSTMGLSHLVALGSSDKTSKSSIAGAAKKALSDSKKNGSENDTVKLKDICRQFQLENYKLNEDSLTKVYHYVRQILQEHYDYSPSLYSMPDRTLPKINVIVDSTCEMARAFIELYNNNDKIRKKEGRSKECSKTFCLTVSKTIAVSGIWAAKLTPNFRVWPQEHYTQLIVQMENEDTLLQWFPESPYIAKQLNGAPYKDINGLDSYVIYQELYIDLADFIAKKGLLSTGQKAMIFHNTLCGLKDLDNRHVVHCDLKYENIFLREDGTAVIGDLGNANGQSVQPNLLPPELWELHLNGKKYTANHRTDVWMLGQVLFEILNGGFARWYELKHIISRCNELLHPSAPAKGSPNKEKLERKENNRDAAPASTTNTLVSSAASPYIDELIKAASLLDPVHLGSLKDNEDSDVATSATIKAIHAFLSMVKASSGEDFEKMKTKIIELKKVLSGKVEQAMKCLESNLAMEKEKNEKDLLRVVLGRMLHPIPAKRQKAEQILKEFEKPLFALAKAAS